MPSAQSDRYETVAEQLRALVAKWQTMHSSEPGNAFSQGIGQSLAMCADELSALLAAAEGVERDAGIGAAVTPDDATIAIESMDAYARKGGITAYGPVGVLRQFVSQYRAMQAELEEAQEMVRSTYGEAAPMRDSGEGR